ncbi:hypothetical protein ABH007_06765 [Bacteroides thetaiotaomicron]|jgi:hypothetical protein|uniref:hypothetical protein n=1 Tax=Bacteroides thetaiotaomicron TaxID=818 RepID=UPI001F357FF3|nr:hypothetical protein [Bacteroides thetaiotaomicron]MCE9148924.1 hypothetical protein [Bacteroides thetaiotaomicron]MDC2012192.1 hypothetical protein [Bacteroides thetaiotaomicron]MDC2016182.1 hypothetical protein [Bacteroides thetaiotaomicron]MDC2034244.1 hypothetical protein [Bacteroides thetaiotaomicron]MDC2039011.1 hypothetical protein [Bacteroides thetaiotaomicron]
MNKNESKARKLICYLKNGGERRTMAADLGFISYVALQLLQEHTIFNTECVKIALLRRLVTVANKMQE